MAKYGHTLYVIILFLAGLLCFIVIGVQGFGYYMTPEEKRPFHTQYDELKPSGVYGHGFGIIGSLMIISGVTLYTSRKRIRALANVGRIKNFLEFHIFLCLVGPLLILYHTTFKFGGLVAVSFWSMAAVVLSGIIGRYLYVQIPKGIHGNELSAKELDEENAKLLQALQQDYGLSPEMIKALDSLAYSKRPVETMGTASMLVYLFSSDVMRRQQLHKIKNYLHRQSVDAALIKSIARIENRRILLLRRIAFLEKLRTVFHHWHVVHLPFTYIMFVILFIHVSVAVAFGYTWIW